MNADLTYLVYTVILCLLLAVLPLLGAMQQGVDLPTLAGNREKMPDLEGWAGRAQRAHRNLLENIVLFAALVLIAKVAGKSNATTAFGAMLFFWGRVAHAAIYIAGVPWLRTVAWLVSIVGLLMILAQLF
jgi:uncharacterized MAPEG superfamily protein